MVMRQVIQTSGPRTSDCNPAAAKIVYKAKQATPPAMEIDGMLPYVTMKRTAGLTWPMVNWVLLRNIVLTPFFVASTFPTSS